MTGEREPHPDQIAQLLGRLTRWEEQARPNWEYPMSAADVYLIIRALAGGQAGVAQAAAQPVADPRIRAAYEKIAQLEELERDGSLSDFGEHALLTLKILFPQDAAPEGLPTAPSPVARPVAHNLRGIANALRLGGFEKGELATYADMLDGYAAPVDVALPVQPVARPETNSGDTGSASSSSSGTTVESNRNAD